MSNLFYVFRALQYETVLKHNNKNIFIKFNKDINKFIIFNSDTNIINIKDKIDIYKYYPLTEGDSFYSIPTQYEEIVGKFNAIYKNKQDIDYIINNISKYNLESTIRLLKDTVK